MKIEAVATLLENSVSMVTRKQAIKANAHSGIPENEDRYSPIMTESPLSCTPKRIYEYGYMRVMKCFRGFC